MREGEKKVRAFAKYLRKNATTAEEYLWSDLRRKQLGGFKFRRQHPIGPYVADFVCMKARLIVEVDGATHSSDEEIEHDRKRTLYLERENWTILRVLNDDIYDNRENVLEDIYRMLPVKEK